jgi:hypothetical protein
MTPRRVRALVWLGLFGLAVCLALPETALGGEGDLDRIVANLQRRQEQVTRFRLRAEGTRFVPKGAESDNFLPPTPGDKSVRPPADEVTELKQEFALDYATRRYRHAYQEVWDGKLESWIRVFDGAKIYGSKLDIPIDEMAGARPGSMSIISGGEQRFLFISSWWPYFMSQGYILTSLRQAYRDHDLRVPIDRENLFVVRQDVFRGQLCDIVRTFPEGPKKTEAYYEYALARDDAAVRRMTHWLGDRKVIEITIDYTTRYGRSVPTAWVNEWYGGKTRRVWKSEKLQVKVCEINPPLGDELFVLTPRAGAIVKGREAPSGPVMATKDDKETVRYYQADEEGRLIEGDLIDGQFRPRTWYFWWWIGGASVLVLVAGFVYRRVRSGRRAQTTTLANPSGGTT